MVEFHLASIIEDFDVDAFLADEFNFNFSESVSSSNNIFGNETFAQDSDNE